MQTDPMRVDGAIDPSWANSTSVANYVWECLSADGKLVVFTQWNANFDSETRMAAFGDPVERVIDESDLAKTMCTWRVKAPYRFRARPLRESAMPFMEIDVPMGGELVWSFKRAFSIGMVPGTEHMQFDYTTLIFGRILPDGKSDIAQIWPNGEVHSHASLAEAYAAR